MGKKTLRSPHSRPTLCHGVPRIFLTAPLSYEAVALHLGQCEKLLRYVKLATSSVVYRRQPVRGGEVRNPSAQIIDQQWIFHHEERLCTLSSHRRKGGVQLVRTAQLQ